MEIPAFFVPVYRNAHRNESDRPRLNLHMRTPGRGFYPLADLPEQVPTLPMIMEVVSGRETRIIASSLTTVEEGSRNAIDEIFFYARCSASCTNILEFLGGFRTACPSRFLVDAW
jgi:hypothetical protein